MTFMCNQKITLLVVTLVKYFNTSLTLLFRFIVIGIYELGHLNYLRSFIYSLLWPVSCSEALSHSSLVHSGKVVHGRSVVPSPIVSSPDLWHSKVKRLKRVFWKCMHSRLGHAGTSTCGSITYKPALDNL